MYEWIFYAIFLAATPITVYFLTYKMIKERLGTFEVMMYDMEGIINDMRVELEDLRQREETPCG